MDFQEEKGFTLIEILLSIVILTIILVSIMNFFPQMGLFNRHNLEKTEAINLAKIELDEWQKKDYTDFFVNPSKELIPEYDHFEDKGKDRYYIFLKKSPNGDYDIEIRLKEKPDLDTSKRKMHELHVRIFDKRNTLISETYGYYLKKED